MQLEEEALNHVEKFPSWAEKLTMWHFRRPADSTNVTAHWTKPKSLLALRAQKLPAQVTVCAALSQQSEGGQRFMSKYLNVFSVVVKRE